MNSEKKKRGGFCISTLLLISDNDILLKKYRVEETCQNAWTWPDKLKYRVTSELSIKFLSTLLHVRFHYSHLFPNVALTIRVQWSRHKYLQKKKSKTKNRRQNFPNLIFHFKIKYQLLNKCKRIYNLVKEKKLIDK